MFEVAVLLCASVTTWLRPRRVPVWAGPVAAAGLVLIAGTIDLADAARAVEDLGPPLLFLVFAVPLAVTLDDVGVFTALAATVDGGRHLSARLWWFAAAVVVVFNLDAAVVLLTPLYIRIARRHGLDVEALAFQPALLACLASGVLPVSNLTNLIVAERLGLGVVDFVTNLALPSLVATGVGFVCHRRVFGMHDQQDRVDDPVDPRALRRGLPVVGLVLVGFTIGDGLGIDAWMVAAVALCWATALTRSARWRAVPADAIATAAGLAVLVATAAPHLGLDRVFGTGGRLGDLGAVAAATAMSAVANNLPTALAASDALGDSQGAWPLLIGTNIGSLFVVTASLSTMLWRDTCAANGLDVSARQWTAVAVRIGAPALVAATATLLVLPR